MFCSVASSSFWLPARVRVLRALSGVWADCLPACLLSICQGCGHSGKKGSEIARQHCESVCECVCVTREGVGMAHHPSGGTMTRPICQPKQGDWSERFWQSGTKTAPLHLPLISLIFSLSSSPAFAPLLFSFIRPCAVFDSSPFFESRVIQLSLSLTLSQLNWWAFSTDYIKCILITLSTEICLILNFCIKSCLISIPPTPCTK